MDSPREGWSSGWQLFPKGEVYRRPVKTGFLEVLAYRVRELSV
jgi:hypothetical protein